MTTLHLSRPRLVAAAAAGCLAVGLAVQLPADAAGAGTWTKISSPVNGATVLRQSGHEGHWTIKGTASSDVSQVNVYCLRGDGSGVSATTVATAVHVGAGAFTTTVPVPSGVSTPQCRLRALPDGVNPQAAYVASYAGPVVNLDSWQALGTTDFQLQASVGSGMLVAASIGSCTTEFLGPVRSDETLEGGSNGCLLALGQDATGNGPGVVVDGHDTVPASDASRFGLSPTPTIHRSFRTGKHGIVSWTDTEALERCQTDTTFPPPASCTLEASGVQVRQVSTLLRSGLQVRVRTEFRSVDGRRHTLRLAFTSVVNGLADGELGVRFPGQQGFHAATAGQKVTRLGHGAGTMLARTNRFADEGDPSVATRALTWSRTPSRIAFSPTEASEFELDYHLTVPKAGSVQLGFADSVGELTSSAMTLAAHGKRDMMSAPAILVPRAGQVIEGTKTTVAGVVYAGANGLPVWVKIDGHRVKLKVAKKGTFARFTDTFHEALGKHTITVLAKDAAGLKRSASVHVRNK
jgi:hypothetical protein